MTEHFVLTDPPELTEPQARIRADQWLAQLRSEVSLVTGQVVETRKSWLFETVSRSGEPVFGNAPVRVDKHTQVVEHCREAWREFGEIPRWDRLLRWWQRGRSY